MKCIQNYDIWPFYGTEQMVLPLQELATTTSGGGGTESCVVRLHPVCHSHTATGRISMAEPSLQCLPNDISVVATVAATNVPSTGQFTTPAMRSLLLQVPSC